MKGLLDRTKAVVRHLPPTISRSNVVEHVDSRFSGRYNWLSFHPGKSSQKHLIHSRAYINFNRLEDVIEFAEFFNGHVFVNEKGAQFKAIVEYAPSQHVPKQSKKDGREGTILKDPGYLEFLEFLSKPIENLPSAEIQLERKEAEQAGAPKGVPIVTPLMDFVRQKRAAKGGPRRAILNGTSTRRLIGSSSRSPVAGSLKRGSERRKSSTTMYVLRDSYKGVSKEKPTYLLVSKQDDEHLTEQSVSPNVPWLDALEGESGSSRFTLAKKKIQLLKGKEKEISVLSQFLFLLVSGGESLYQNVASPARTSHGSASFRQNQQNESSGGVIRRILLKRDTLNNQAPWKSQSELRIQDSNQERDGNHPRTQSIQSSQKETDGISENGEVCNDLNVIHYEKQMRNKDIPDHGSWTPLWRSDRSNASDNSLSSPASGTSPPIEDVKHEILVGCVAEQQYIGGGCSSHSYVDNSFYRHGGRRGSGYNSKNADGSSLVEVKSTKRGVSSGYGSHEKQVWVQKSGSGS